jgi:hypothetical protein
MVNGINSAQVTSPLVSNNSSQYPENLSEIADSADSRSKSYGKYTQQQILDASKKLNAREYAAFGYFGNDASSQGIKSYAEAYLKYINQLSPDEQNGVRYKGTKENMTALLAAANAQIAEENAHPGKKPVKPTSLLLMMLDEMMIRLKKNPIHADASSNAANSADRVTISEEARKISGQA